MLLRPSLLLAILLSMSPTSVGAPPPALGEADRLFANGDFKAAATAYRSLLETCFVASAQPTTTNAPISPGPDVVEPTITLPASIRPVAKGGSPVLLALISERGEVLELRVVRPAGEAIDAAAGNALRAAQIKPATRAGLPVRMWVTKAVTIPGVE